MAVKLIVKDVSVYYESIKALDGINISFEDGCITTLVGPNGAGKTTLLKCLNGILKPTMGTVFIDGYEVQKLKPIELAKKFGYVPQFSSSYLSFTVKEIVTMGRRPYINWSLSEYDKKVINDSLKIVGIEHLANRFFNELSGGEKQKVIIARALAQEPKVLLLDEPTSNLDLKHQLEILKLIGRLAKERNLTVIMAMHDLNMAYRFSDKIVMIKNGSIFAVGKPKEVLTPENIEAVYGVKVSIYDKPYPQIIPIEVI